MTGARPTGGQRTRLPPWPSGPLVEAGTCLRQFRPADAGMAVELALDPYVPLIGTLPARATDEQALAWVRRQIGRWHEGTGFSFAVAELASDDAVGQCGLWLRDLAAGRATAGYLIAPRHRRRGHASAALRALTRFAWTLDGLDRVELYVEPANVASARTAAGAGYRSDALLRAHQTIGGRRRDMERFAALRPGGAGLPGPDPVGRGGGDRLRAG